MAVRTYISIMTINVNTLNASTKRHTLAKWIQSNIHIYAVFKTHFTSRDTYKLKVSGRKKILYANGNQKKAGVSIIISDKIDLKIENIIRIKEGHYIMIKGSIEEEVQIVNIYETNTGSSQYIR